MPGDVNPAMPVARRLQRFEVIDQLGSGGMGAVFRARDPQLERDVAIKVLAQADAAVAGSLVGLATVDLRGPSADRVGDLLHEARMMARLSHPNVLPVYEVGLAGGEMFVVMECVDGCDLGRWLAARRSTAEILAVFAQAGRGLAAAHAHDLVHRDFKPANVLIGDDGRVRVADFGLSRLVARAPGEPTSAIPGHGTPRYMAPELWRGVEDTPASDVYAFCVALIEALEAAEDAGRERAVPPAVRALVARGIAEDPAARPGLPAIIAALDRRAGVLRAGLVVGLGAVAISAGLVAAIALLPGTPPPVSCEPPPGISAGWDNARRAAIRRALVPEPRVAARSEGVERAVAAFDAHQREVIDGARAVCRALGAGALTPSQAAIRRSCLERRAYALAATVGQLIQAPPAELGDLLDRTQLPRAAACDDLSAPPLPVDRAPVIALFQRLAAAEALGSRDLQVAPFEAIASAALALGERELEMVAVLDVGLRLRSADQLAAGDEALRRAYRLAVDLRDVATQGRVLVERSRLASVRGDAVEAGSLARLAADVAERPTTAPAARGRIFAALAPAQLGRGELTAALVTIDKAIDQLARDGHRLPSVELTVRMARARALAGLDGHEREVIAVERDTVAWAAAAFGEHSARYAQTLALLGAALADSGDLAGGLASLERAMAVMVAATAPGSALVERARYDTVQILLQLDRNADAEREVSAVLAAAERNEGLRALRGQATTWLGFARCQLGRWAEGLPLMSRGLELMAEQFGADHALTLSYRVMELETQLDLGKLADAGRTIKSLEAAYQAQPEPHDLRLTLLRGVEAADLARRQGRPRRAEALARVGLAAWAELGGAPRGRAGLLAQLAGSLLEQRRWAPARATTEQALALARTIQGQQAAIAELEVQLAVADAALGHRREALARARRARAVLERYPLALRARRLADQLLGNSPSPGDTRRGRT